MLDLLFLFFFLKNKSPAPFSRLSRMLQHGFAVKLQKLFCGNITRLPLGAAGGDKDWVNCPSEPETCHPQTWCLRAPDRFIPNLFSSSHLKLILDFPPQKKTSLHGTISIWNNSFEKQFSPDALLHCRSGQKLVFHLHLSTAVSVRRETLRSPPAPSFTKREKRRTGLMWVTKYSLIPGLKT